MREEIISIFEDIKKNWRNTKNKGDSMPVDYCENGCSKEQLENVKKKFASNLKMSEIVLFFDSTIGKSGKSGFIFTTTGYYSSSINFLNKIGKRTLVELPLLYEDIENIEWEPGDSDFILYYKDGTKRYGNESINTHFVVLMLRRIIDVIKKQPELLKKEDIVPTEYTTKDSLEDVPESILKVSRKSKKIVEDVIIPIQEKQKELEKNKKESIITKWNHKIEKVEEDIHKWYSDKFTYNKRKLILNLFLILEVIILIVSLLISNNPKELFSNVYGCTVIGTITNFFIAIANNNLSSYVGYSNYMMAGISAILLAIYEIELNKLKIKRFMNFLHIILFTYTSGLVLVYVWQGIVSIYTFLLSLPIINILIVLLGIMISIVLLFLGFQELISNMKNLMLSILIGTFFMIGILTVMSLLPLPSITISNKNEFMYTYIRITIFCGYGIICAFKNAWNDIKKTNVHKIEEK